MATLNKRTTVYFDPDLHHALRLKALETDSSVSELINEMVALYLAEDAEDLRLLRERVGDVVLSYEEAVEELRVDGKL